MKKIELNHDLVIAQYYAFRSCNEVAKIYGCNPETIRRVLMYEGVSLSGWKTIKREPTRTVVPIDDAERQRIIDEFTRCGTITKTQKVTNRGYIAIKKVLSEAGIEVKPNGQKITDDEILADIAEGLTRQEIADRHGVHVENLARRMRKLGVHATYEKNRGGGDKNPLSNVWHWTDSGKAFIDKYCGDKFEFIEYKRRYYRIQCKVCGAITERERSSIRYYNTTCEVCAEREKRAKELQDKRIEMMRFFYALKELKTPKVCAKCGNTFYSQYPSAKYCSKGCKRRVKARATNYRERCRKYGVYYDPSVSREKVIERDNGICQICGIKCNPNDLGWGTLGATFPTVDHIIPLAKGGTHTWDNVQCACALCNSNKRDIV